MKWLRFEDMGHTRKHGLFFLKRFEKLVRFNNRSLGEISEIYTCKHRSLNKMGWKFGEMCPQV